MARLIVRNIDERLIRALMARAAKHGHSVEAEHRRILRRALLGDLPPRDDFAERATDLRARLKSGCDSTEIIRADRDRGTVG